MLLHWHASDDLDIMIASEVIRQPCNMFTWQLYDYMQAHIMLYALQRLCSAVHQQQVHPSTVCPYDMLYLKGPSVYLSCTCSTMVSACAALLTGAPAPACCAGLAQDCGLVWPARGAHAAPAAGLPHDAQGPALTTQHWPSRVVHYIALASVPYFMLRPGVPSTWSSYQRINMFPKCKEGCLAQSVLLRETHIQT